MPDVGQVLGRVDGRVGLLLLRHDARVQLARLVVVVLLALVPEVGAAAADGVGGLVGRLGGVVAELGDEGRGHVLRVAGRVGVHTHRAADVGAAVGHGHEGTVDGDLVQVDADAVVLRVAVEEHAELQERVGGVLDTRDHGAGREGGLLDVAVVVLGVLVEDQAAELLHGEEVAGPDLGDVEGVETELLGVGVLGLHHLHVGGPLDLLAVLDGVPQVALGVVRVLAAHLDGLGVGETLGAVLGHEVVLDVDELAGGVDPLERVAAVAVVVAPADGGAVVGEEHETGVVALGVVAEEVKGGFPVEEEVAWVAVLRPDHIGTLDGVAAEEDGKVETDNVVVALGGVELDGEATGVAGLVGELTAQSDSGEAHEDGGLLTRLLEEVGLGEVAHVAGALEEAKGAGTAGVDHTLEGLGAVEVLLLLEEEGVAGDGDTADGLAVGGIRPGDAFVVGEVRGIVGTLASRGDAGNLGDDVGGTLVGAHHVCGTRSAVLTLHGTRDGLGSGQERVLARVGLV